MTGLDRFHHAFCIHNLQPVIESALRFQHGRLQTSARVRITVDITIRTAEGKTGRDQFNIDLEFFPADSIGAVEIITRDAVLIGGFPFKDDGFPGAGGSERDQLKLFYPERHLNRSMKFLHAVGVQILQPVIVGCPFL